MGDDWVARCQAAVAGLLQDDAYAARCVAARLVPRLFPLFPDLQARAPALVTGATMSAIRKCSLSDVSPITTRTVPLTSQNACRVHCLGLLSLAPAQEPEGRKRAMQPDVGPCITAPQACAALARSRAPPST